MFQVNYSENQFKYCTAIILKISLNVSFRSTKKKKSKISIFQEDFHKIGSYGDFIALHGGGK